MNWSTLRRFLAAWIGVTIGHVSAGIGAAYRTKLLDQTLKQIHENPSLTIGLILGVSAIHTTAVMLGHHEKDAEVRRVGRGVPPRNYFSSGLVTAWVVWLCLASFAGFGVDLSQLFRWLIGGG